MKRNVGRAVPSFKGPNVGLNVGTARYIYSLRDRVCKERWLRKVPTFAKASKSASLEIRDKASMQVIGLHLGGHDSNSGNGTANVLREARNVVDDLIDAPSGNNVRNGRNDVAGRYAQSVLCHCAEARRAVDDNVVIPVDQRQKRAAQNFQRIRGEVSCYWLNCRLEMRINENRNSEAEFR